MVQQIDGLGNSTSYQYNALNQKKTMSDPLNRATQYSYDGVGNLLTVQNPKDSSASYTIGYDVANQIKTITYADGHTPNVSYSYDKDSQRQQMVDGTGTTSYSFDSLHRLTHSTNGSNAQVQYGYDLAGHLTSLGYPGAIGTIARTYDDGGRLASVTDWYRNTTRFTYDPNSNPVTENYPNGATATFTYDAADRLLQIVDSVNGNQFLNLTYSRDGSNQVKAENSTTYGYDPNKRLTSVAIGASPVSYGYDAGDNLTKLIGINTTTQAFDLANQLQTATTINGSTQVQKYTYAYDLNGNRTSQTDKNNVATNFGWDQANRLTTYGSAATYTYNGDGLRMSKTVSGTAEPFVWDTAQGLPLIIEDGSTSYVTGLSGLPLEQINGSTVTYYHQDQLGSTRALTNASGAVVASYGFDAYGNAIGTPPTFANPFRLGGQYMDNESGWQYLRARYYDPTNGQFVSRDPLVISTREAYAYVQDNPLNASDPTGMACWAFWDPKQCDNMLTSAMNEFAGTHGDPKAIAEVIYTHTVVSISGCVFACGTVQFQGGVVSGSAGGFGYIAKGLAVGWAEKRPQDRCDRSVGMGAGFIGGVQASVGSTPSGGFDKGDSEIDLFAGVGGWVGGNETVFSWEPGNHNRVRLPLMEHGF